MADVKQTFASASVINAETVVFNIHGNRYRLVAKVFFPAHQLYVKHLMTHADYDDLDL